MGWEAKLGEELHRMHLAACLSEGIPPLTRVEWDRRCLEASEPDTAADGTIAIWEILIACSRVHHQHREETR